MTIDAGSRSRTPSAPSKPLPAGAWDTHAHVFGPFDKFPLDESALYAPPLAPKNDYLAMLDTVGFDYGVLVHGGACGWDHSAMLDAIAAAPDRLRGIGVLPPATTDSQLSQMNDAGLRGIRFTEMGGAPQPSAPGRLGLDDLQLFAPRLRELGWHAVIWSKIDVLAAAAPRLRTLGLPIIVDHMGFFDVERGVEDSAFQTLVELVRDGVVWVKLIVFRNSKTPPNHEDVRPFHDALIAANLERLLWGSDWPYIGMSDYVPEGGKILNLMDEWMGDDALRHRVLVDNPSNLYGFK